MAKLNGVFIIPTGLGCALGGNAAFNSGVKLIAACCDNLIVNPNAVNASDINEAPPNSLYVEGSTIDRFLEGQLNLRKIKKYNRILMVVNSPITPLPVNAYNAGIWGLGADIQLLALNTPLMMTAELNPDGTAGGTYSGVVELIDQLENVYEDFDALAIQTPIDCNPEVATNYWVNGGVNPWGGIEAIVSRIIAEGLDKPVAHAPLDDGEEQQQKLYAKLVVSQSMAPEIVSNAYMFCVLKGLHQAPQLELDVAKFHPDILSRDDVDFLVTPHGCFGRPHVACVMAGIPVIVVRENTTCFSEGFIYSDAKELIFVDNYLEAAGVVMAMSAGVDYRTIRVEK